MLFPSLSTQISHEIIKSTENRSSFDPASKKRSWYLPLDSSSLRLKLLADPPNGCGFWLTRVDSTFILERQDFDCYDVIIHFSGMFPYKHYKPSSYWGTPMAMETPMDFSTLDPWPSNSSKCSSDAAHLSLVSDFSRRMISCGRSINGGSPRLWWFIEEHPFFTLFNIEV